MPGEGESPPVRGGVSAAVKKLWGRLNSAAEGLVLTVGQLVSVPFVIMGMTSTKLVTQSGYWTAAAWTVVCSTPSVLRSTPNRIRTAAESRPASHKPR